MFSSQVSLLSPKPFPWDSAEQTIRLVTPSNPAPHSDYQPALDYFDGIGRPFSYGLQPSDFESFDSIAIPSVENHADDERSSGDDRSLASCGHDVPSDEVPSLTHSSLSIHQESKMPGAANEVSEEHVVAGNLVNAADRSMNALVRDELIKSVESSPIFVNTLERKQFVALLKEPTSHSESVDRASVENLSVLGFLNSNPCPPESSVGQSIPSSSQTQLTERSSSGRGGDTSLTDETSIEGHPAMAHLPVFRAVKLKHPAEEFGSYANWNLEPRHEYWMNKRLAEMEEQQKKKKKGFLNRARNLLRRLRWRK